MFTLDLKKELLVGIYGLIIVAGGYMYVASSDNNDGVGVGEESRYIADFTDMRNIIAFADNAFVAEVVRVIDNTESDGMPVTLYEVNVVHNIKGDLQGVVTVMQVSGYYETDKGREKSVIGGEFLEVGKLYLLATGYDPIEDYYVINSHPNATKLLGTNIAENSEKQKEDIRKSDDVKEWENAYKNENKALRDVWKADRDNYYKEFKKEKGIE
ncbi:MAG: hypothetical protein RLZZ230_332 [Candidatus Parcubacteria bacterium]|jgi:hypothetical protein